MSLGVSVWLIPVFWVGYEDGRGNACKALGTELGTHSVGVSSLPDHGPRAGYVCVTFPVGLIQSAGTDRCLFLCQVWEM